MDPITEDEAKEMREVLAGVYGDAASDWTIRYETYELLDRLLRTSARCTKAMHWVPRPWDLSSPLKWAQRQVREAIVRYLKTPDGQYYVACLRTAARNFRTEFERVSYGL